ncbi:MAG: SRPBCC domain-containing protein [Candidatus Solibacter usitatus]|nr:SRPBCC domain-containing protein [Candidatus Solibacter usitatus]
MGLFEHQLDRAVVIQAAPETVFRYFTDSARWAKWWGAGSTIDAQPGGRVYIRHPNGIEMSGEVLEVSAPRRIVFTYGFESGKPIPPGASRVTILLTPDAAGTRLRLTHEFDDAAVRDHHVQGWRFQLSLFGNVVSDEVNAGAEAIVDGWFDAWAITDAGARDAAFQQIAVAGLQFRDRYSLLDSLEEVSAHAAAAQMYMPGIRMHRTGGIRHCQGTVLAEWVAAAADGKQVMSGTNVFTLGADGRIQSATGLANHS